MGGCNGMDRQTLCNWVHRHDAKGVDGLRSGKSPGRKPFFTKQKKPELRDLVISGLEPGHSQGGPLAIC